MSKIFSKSISDKYSRYFASIDEVCRQFAIFSLKTGELDKKQTAKFYSWDKGKGGIPISWDTNNQTVSVDHTDSHTLVVGPTGSKKSRLVVMPTVRILGSMGESMIISDPKAEIYNRTAAYLKNKGYNIYVLNLRSPLNGNRWNPLAIPYEFYIEGKIDKACEFVNDIAENLIQKDQSETEPFWDKSAGTFFFGLVLLLFKYCKENNLGKEYVHMSNVNNLRYVLLGQNKVNKELWEYAKEDSIIRSSLVGTIETANDTKAGILSVFDQKTRMFSIQPNLMDMLGANDFDFNTISRQPTAVFLIIPDEKTGYHDLAALFIKQSYEYMIYNAQQDAEGDGTHTAELQNRVNYILDEFSSLPTIKDFPPMITAARSRNIRFLLIIQSKHQLISRYGDEADTIQTNCNNWIYLTSRELKLLEELSTLTGKTLDDVPSPVLSVSDLQRLDKNEGEALLLCGRHKPCITILADIEEYDENKFEHLSITTRTLAPVPSTDFVLSEKIKSRIRDLNNPFGRPFDDKTDTWRPVKDYKRLEDKVDVDELISAIDKKIAELEKEETMERNKNDEKKGQKNEE